MQQNFILTIKILSMVLFSIHLDVTNRNHYITEKTVIDHQLASMYTNVSLMALAVGCVLPWYLVPQRQNMDLSSIIQMFVVITSLYEQASNLAV